MRRHVLGTIGGLILVAGCGGGGGADPVDPLLQQLAQCTRLSFEQLASLVFAFLDTVEAVADPTLPPPGVTYDPSTGAFSVDLDFDGDSVTDTVVSGTASGPSTHLDLLWSVTGLFTGNGSFLLAYNTDGTTGIFGSGSLTTASGCTFDVSRVNVVLDPAAPGGDLMPTGSFSYVTDDNAGEILTGGFLFGDPGEVLVTTSFRGRGRDMYIDLDTFELYFD